MLEFTRLDVAASARPGQAGQLSSGLVVGIATTREEVEQAQRLRYQVFTEDLGVVFPQARDGLDEDRFDPWCRHLLVRELDSGRVVGTYRILTPEAARQAGGYYSESEFDLSGLAPIRSGLVEFGRSCTHADYRNGAAIMLLWSGLAEFLRRGNYRYVLGCASVSLRDDGAAAAEVYRTAGGHLAQPTPMRVRPLHRLPIERLGEGVGKVGVPPLIKGYLKLGARICGEPAWDPDFHAADFPMLLSVNSMNERYRKRFGLRASQDAAA